MFCEVPVEKSLLQEVVAVSLLGKLAPAVCFPSQRRWEHPGGTMFCSGRAGQELF